MGDLTANFSLSEFKCHDGTAVPAQYIANVKKLAGELQIIRDAIGKPIIVNSGYRTPAYNAKQDGAAPKSQHLVAKAADCRVSGMSPLEFYKLVEKLIADGKLKYVKGVGLYNSFVHVDVRDNKSRWNFSNWKI